MKSRLYIDKISQKTKAKRLLWNLTWFCLAGWTPRFFLHGWRIFILRLWGAKIGTGCKIAPSANVWAPWNLEIGDYTAIAEKVDCYCVDRISIGSHCAISQRAFLCTASHDIKSLLRPLIHSPIHIENHAWVCAHAIIYPGVTLGEGSVVAAGSVVVKSVEKWNVVGGNPAKFIKLRSVDEAHSQSDTSQE